MSGSLHLPFVWFLLERYRDRIDSVVLVDEGLSTYAGPEGDRNKVSKIVQNIQQPEIEQAYRAFVDFPATYYSRFPLLKQLGPHDSFEPVDRSVLPHLLKYDDVPTAPCIYFIGQPLRHLIAEPALDAAMTSLAVHITRRLHPGSEVVYIPHRHDEPEKLQIMKTVVDVRDLGHPIELEGLVAGVAPRRLATFCSAAAISLGMADADVEVETFRLPDRVMKALGVEAYHATSDIFTKLIGEQVIDYDLDAGVQRSDGTVLMPPGLLDEFLTTHKPEPGATGWRHRPGWLPDIAYGDLPLADVTVLLGSDGESGLQPPETAVEQTEAMIKFARSLDPDAWLLYVPEPSESEEKRTRLEALVEVERRALPAELLPFEWGYRPRRVVTVRSSCFGALVAAGAEGWVLRPDPTGYDVEETAILDAHRHYRALVDGDVCWARLPEATADPAEALVTAQRRHSADQLALRLRVADLEGDLERSRELSRRRYYRVGDLRRRLDQRARRIAVLKNKLHTERQRNSQLKRRFQQIGQPPDLQRWTPRRVAAGVRRRLSSGR